ncbi:MAG: hypothetical protein H6741_07730 [Alphaproteobacteria bacterium]|nr:hypothetical protein [Alphaproteobacteria bacterium]MCB9792606.1 hypothetical protein [Alphaproteobacteria bacterium]
MSARWGRALLRFLVERPWLSVSLACALFVLWGVLGAPSRWVAGTQFLDAMGTHWFYWYAEQTVSGHEGLERSQLLFYPFGKDVYLHTGGNLIDAYLALPLRAAMGHIAGYNATIALILLLDGWGAARLARAVGAGPLGQAAAALALCLNPYVLIELDQGRPTQALVAFLPLGLAFLMERRAVAAGICIALCGLTYWYYGVVAGMAAALSGALALGTDPDRGAVVRTWGLAALICVAIVLPVAWPMLSTVEAGGVPGLLLYDAAGPLGGLHLRTAEGDAQGLFIQALSGWAGPVTPVGGVPEFAPSGRLFTPAQLLLAAPALVLGGRRALTLGALGALALLIGVGPVLWIGGPDNPLYQALLSALPFMRRWWWPMRASALLQVSLAVLVGITANQLAAWGGAAAERRGAGVQRWARPALYALLLPLAWLWSAGQAPLHRWSGEVSELVSGCLAEAPEGAVMDLPLAWDQFHLYHQVWHGKPQMGGMLSQKAAFGAGAVDQLLEENAFAGLLVGWGKRELSKPPAIDEAGRAALLEVGYRYLILRHEAMRLQLPDGRELDDAKRVARMISKVLGPPAAQDLESEHPVTLWALDGSGWRCP